MLHWPHPTTPISSSSTLTVTHQCHLQQLYRVLSGQSRSACRSSPKKCTSSHQQSCMLPKSLLAEVTGYDNIHNIMSKNTVHCVYVINTHMYTLLWICTLTIIVVVIPSMKMFYLLFFSLILTFVPPSLFLFIYNPHFSQFVSLSLVIIIPETKWKASQETRAWNAPYLTYNSRRSIPIDILLLAFSSKQIRLLIMVRTTLWVS